jgi:hypothetical protein
MVAVAAYEKAKLGLFTGLRLDVWPNLDLETGLDKLEV